MVQKVVAIGTPSACRKVLYCIEQIKLIATWEIWKGAESGTKPSAAMKRISMPTRMVSQRRNLMRVSLREIASETNAPII